jgi:hypothetical protein
LLCRTRLALYAGLQCVQRADDEQDRCTKPSFDQAFRPNLTR